MEALIVVDMQKDFCYKNGALYIPNAEDIFEPTARIVNKARRKMPVIFTQDWHREDDVEFKIWPKHCVMNTEGAEVIDELEPQEKDYFIRKRRYSAFFGTDLDLLLRELGVEKLYICGVATNICVLHTAGDAALRGYKVAVIKDCTKALSDYEYEYGIRHMESIFKAEIISSEIF
ncbi:cysteine hydrolase family protein [Archaeoglobus neptunius]|uniref:cysteine hydrolase family protein n=1 Tax=Archaeoglobus neptunius TaxID=2798580 RepID=UPI0019261F36|nr:isochorismatase family cysteine hydrolase [Archaeoglobus neptunius]